jgi:DNA-binding MarR family transcriptional regulator
MAEKRGGFYYARHWENIMAETLTPAGAPPPPDPISADELAKVISTMNRFLSKFVALEAFAQAKLTVADWTVLMNLLELKEARYPYLASLTGIADQRTHRLVEALVGTGWIASTPSTDPARPNPVLSLTDSGKARLTALNEALKPLLLKAYESTPNYLVSLKHGLLPLMRIITP